MAALDHPKMVSFSTWKWARETILVPEFSVAGVKSSSRQSLSQTHLCVSTQNSPINRVNLPNMTTDTFVQDDTEVKDDDAKEVKDDDAKVMDGDGESADGDDGDSLASPLESYLARPLSWRTSLPLTTVTMLPSEHPERRK